MPSVPRKYRHILAPDAPRLIREAAALYGTTEVVGPSNNPVIMGWAKEVNIRSYTGDIIPWCGLFAAVVCKRAGHDSLIPNTPLWARSWATNGTVIDKDDAAFGDILVFTRDGGGHVGFYVGEDTTHFHVLGGNQQNTVNCVRILKRRCIAVRRPIWKVAQPDSVKKLRLAGTGFISNNEA